MKRIKAYFFQKELEEFKKSGVSKPTKRTGSILFVLEHRQGNIDDQIAQIKKLMSGSGYRIYYLIFDTTNQLDKESKLSIYSKKDLNWRSGFANKEVLSILKQAHHLILFPQNIFRPDFQFIALAGNANFKIGHQELAKDYGLDIGFELQTDAIKDFIDQLFLILPESLERSSKKKSALQKSVVKKI